MKTEKKIILIVDDIQTNRKLLSVMLGAEGYETVEAADGVEALHLLEVANIDLIISDILMPNMDGFQLCREVRNSGRHKATPFVFHSSTYTAACDQKVAKELGADGFLMKP